MFGLVQVRRIDGAARFGGEPGPVVFGRVLANRIERQVADHFALVTQDKTAMGRGLADSGDIQIPFAEDALGHMLTARLDDDQHPFLGFRQHHLIGGHVLFALGHMIEIQLDAEAARRGHLHGRGGEAGRAHVLDRADGVFTHQFETRLDQLLLGEGVADLNGGAVLFRAFAEFRRRHGGAVNAVATGLRAHIEDGEVGLAGGCGEDLVGVREAHGHGVHQDVAVIALVEIGLAADRRHAHAIAIAANAGGDAGDQLAGLGVLGVAKAQRVHQRHRAGAHGEDVAQNAAHARGRALIGLDIAGVVVALHLEDGGLTVANVDDAGVLARAIDHLLALGGEFGQVQA